MTLEDLEQSVVDSYLSDRKKLAILATIGCAKALEVRRGWGEYEYCRCYKLMSDEDYEQGKTEPDEKCENCKTKAALTALEAVLA